MAGQDGPPPFGEAFVLHHWSEHFSGSGSQRGPSLLDSVSWKLLRTYMPSHDAEDKMWQDTYSNLVYSLNFEVSSIIIPGS